MSGSLDMSPKQGRLFLELYQMAVRTGINNCLVGGPRRGKAAAAMAEAGWLTDQGPVGLPIPLGRAYAVTNAGVAAYNAQRSKPLGEET